LRSYIKLKADYGETKGYVQRTRVKAHTSLLAHLRGGTAPLQIEMGRYVCLPVGKIGSWTKLHELIIIVVEYLIVT